MKNIMNIVNSITHGKHSKTNVDTMTGNVLVLGPAGSRNTHPILTAKMGNMTDGNTITLCKSGQGKGEPVLTSYAASQGK